MLRQINIDDSIVNTSVIIMIAFFPIGMGILTRQER